MMLPNSRFRLLSGALLPCLPLLFSSCSTIFWSDNADKEAYSILQSNEEMLFGQKTSFQIEPYSPEDPQGIEAVEILTDRRSKTERQINLVEAVELSVKQSRQYQTEKDNLYLVGMELSRAQDRLSGTCRLVDKG